MEMGTSHLLNTYCSSQGFSSQETQEFMGLSNSIADNRAQTKQEAEEIQKADNGEDIYSS